MNSKLLLRVIITIMLCGSKTFSQNIAINTSGAAANTSAGLDVDFTNKGLLIPRVALTSSTDAATIAAPATSLLVYNPGTGGLAPAGYYYNSGTSGSPVWVHLLNGGSPGTAWMLAGNASTNPPTDFLGTTDAKDVVFKTTGLERMRLLSNGTLKFTGTTTTSPGIWMEANVSAAAATAYGILSRGTLTAIANNDKFLPFSTNLGVANTGTFTGLTFYGVHVEGSSWTKTGTGTIDNSYGLYITTPTIATNNYAGVFTGGNVGIGTTTPAVRLDVTANTSTLPAIAGGTVARFSNLDGSNTRVVLDSYGSVNNLTMRMANGTAAAPSALLAGDAIGTLAFSGYGATSYASSGRTQIVGYAAQNWTDAAQGTYLIFNTTPIGSVSMAERMRIDNNGNVGIGTSNPLGQLHISTSVNQASFLMSDIKTAGNQLGRIVYDGGTIVTGGGWVFQKMTDAGVFTANLVSIIQNSGNVGIGTILPTEKLHVEAGSEFINGESQGIIVDAAGLKRAGLMKYPGLEAMYIGNSVTPSGLSIRIGRWSGGTINSPTTIFNDLIVQNNGNVGIGTITPGYLLQVGNAADGTQARANAWNTLSDKRLKKNFEILPDAIGKIMQLNGYYYYWKEGKDKNKQFGVISQEVQAVLPEITSIDAEGYISVDYSKLTPLLINAIKEQQKIIEEQKAENESQKKEIESLNVRFAGLESIVKTLQLQISTSAKK